MPERILRDVVPSRRIGKQYSERTVEDLGGIAGGNDMPEQILDPTKLVVRLARNRQLYLETIRRQRRRRRRVGAGATAPTGFLIPAEATSGGGLHDAMPIVTADSATLSAVGTGSFRMTVGTAGLGCSAATSNSTSRLDLALDSSPPQEPPLSDARRDAS